jgi:hypothetical protein
MISDLKTTELNERAINVMAEKIKGIYHIDYDVILEMIDFFVTFNSNENISLKIFEGDPIGDPIIVYPYMKNTPEYMLRFYAEQYYNQKNDQYGKILVLKTDKIKEAYHNNTNPIERDAKIICGILGLDFPGSSVGQEYTEVEQNQNNVLPPSPPKNQNDVLLKSLLPSNPYEAALPSNPNEIPIIFEQSSNLVQQDGYDGQYSYDDKKGGKKRNNKKSKTIRLGGRKKSKKSILIKKHLNKRASTYTNARTKKSNSK